MFYYVKLNICLFLFLLVIFSHVGAQRVATILPVLPNSGVFPYAQTETGKCTMNFDIKGDGIDFISNTFTSCTFSPATPCQFTVKEANRTHFLARSSVMYSPGTYINIQISIVLSNSTTVQYTLGDKINNSAYTMVCEAPPISPITATLSPPVLYISSYSINTFRSSSYLTLPDIIKRPITDLACESPIVCTFNYIKLNYYYVEFFCQWISQPRNQGSYIWFKLCNYQIPLPSRTLYKFNIYINKRII